MSTKIGKGAGKGLLVNQPVPQSCHSLFAWLWSSVLTEPHMHVRALGLALHPRVGGCVLAIGPQARMAL